MTKEDLDENPRADQILTAAKAGKVPVHLVSGKWTYNPSSPKDSFASRSQWEE
jgi:hypothetical protein